MADLFKAIYEVIIRIFGANVPEEGEKANIFTSIKEAFDSFFAGLTK